MVYVLRSIKRSIYFSVKLFHVANVSRRFTVYVYRGVEVISSINTTVIITVSTGFPFQLCASCVKLSRLEFKKGPDGVSVAAPVPAGVDRSDRGPVADR